MGFTLEIGDFFFNNLGPLVLPNNLSFLLPCGAACERALSADYKVLRDTGVLSCTKGKDIVIKYRQIPFKDLSKLMNPKDKGRKMHLMCRGFVCCQSLIRYPR